MGNVEATLVRDYAGIRQRFYSRPKFTAPPDPVRIDVVCVCGICETRTRFTAMPASARLTCHHILEVVCRFEGVRVSDVKSPSRTDVDTWPRHIAMYLCHTLTKQSYNQIARIVGRRDHTTVKHGVERIAAARAVDAKLDERLKEYERVLGGSHA